MSDKLPIKSDCKRCNSDKSHKSYDNSFCKMAQYENNNAEFINYIAGDNFYVLTLSLNDSAIYLLESLGGDVPIPIIGTMNGGGMGVFGARVTPADGVVKVFNGNLENIFFKLNELMNGITPVDLSGYHNYYPLFTNCTGGNVRPVNIDRRETNSSQLIPYTYMSVQVDPCVDLCAVIANINALYVMLLNILLSTQNNNYDYNHYPVTPIITISAERILASVPVGNNIIPKVKVPEFITSDKLNDLIVYIVNKINCLPITNCSKNKIIKKILQQQAKLDVVSCNKNNKKSLNGKVCAIKSCIPDCGPIYIANYIDSRDPCADTCGAISQIDTVDRSDGSESRSRRSHHHKNHKNNCKDKEIVLNFVLYIKYIINLFYATSCNCSNKCEDCDLSVDEICKYIFNRFCIIDVVKTN